MSSLFILLVAVFHEVILAQDLPIAPACPLAKPPCPLNCKYGTVWIIQNGCSVCVCKDPCEKTICPPNMQTSITSWTDPKTKIISTCCNCVCSKLPICTGGCVVLGPFPYCIACPYGVYYTKDINNCDICNCAKGPIIIDGPIPPATS